MYYKSKLYRGEQDRELEEWLKNGKLDRRMGRGLRATRVNKRTDSGYDLIRGFDNYTDLREEAGEAPVADGRGGYVPSGGMNMPPAGERSRLDSISYDGADSRDMRLMQELYGQINSFLLPIVKEVIDDNEYSGSTVYHYDLPPMQGQNGGTLTDEEPDRDFINRLVDEVYNKAVMRADSINEIVHDDNSTLAGSTREELLRAAIESLVLTELFLTRRPFYRNVHKAYRFFNGRYDGVNPTV